jgi:hypothetical protein
VASRLALDPVDKSLLERAAAAAHLNVSAFVLQAAAARAEELDTKAACRAVVVSAIHSNARRWWEYLGFHHLDTDDERCRGLYLLTAEIQVTLDPTADTPKTS